MANDLKQMLESIADPTDFPPDRVAPGLRSLDQALRCSICSEIYQAPMNLPCGHCFCSFCIRQSLQREEHCPSCRKVVSESGLRKDISLEEVAIAWNMAREFVLRLTCADVSKKENGKKRKRSVDMNSVNAGPSKIRHASDDNGTSRKEEAREEEEAEMEVDGNEALSSDIEEDVQEITECPVCHNKVLFNKINQHIDKGCRLSPSDTAASLASKAKKKDAWSFLGGGSGNEQKGKNKMKMEAVGKEMEVKEEEDEEEPNRMAKVTYNVQSDKKLRQMLKDLRLPSQGDRTTLVARHTQFTIIYNSNLDKARRLRRPHNELVKELREWELNKSTKKFVVKDVEAYTKANKDVFAHHIAQARKNRPKSSTENHTPQISKVLDNGNESPTTPGLNEEVKAVVKHDDDTIVLSSEDDS